MIHKEQRKRRKRQMETGVKLGRILGIPVRLHVSWFLIFGLVTWSLAVSYFPVEYPILPAAACWGLGAVTSLLFFGSVLAHELSHSLVALRSQVPVHGITLFIFGGVAQIGREPATPATSSASPSPVRSPAWPWPLVSAGCGCSTAPCPTWLCPACG
jgi:Zn-dependent protease